ncbi:Alpha-L-fucosidase [Novipirellula aureliae]|uniref:alpha-L-fucosidase n=1 Tax=Novipirellula aureliae TaxID=2527966 RepID=A0A5C6DCZ4_9BACT|nr:alpha-L-fucosidase [Novipirellula aureliae]TWU34592.1 Alpha-L-fucosidase [Novipirellula aureliae]
MKKISSSILLLICTLITLQTRADEMDQLWGESVVKLRAEDAERGQLFADGNYAMFIHWGVYSQIANQVDGKTYYGIGEWIMNNRMAGIPIPRYRELAKTFNPVNFDAMEVAQLAKDAGMKYIIVTAKHHDGFAMYHSKVNSFNIGEVSPIQIDPMKELAEACRQVGLGFGFYYSHNQDWTFPGGGNGPKTDAEGNLATFDDYFQKKCLPQVKEITSEYGPIVLVWFDTPGNMPKEYVQQLVDVVRKNQPNAFVSGRAGHSLGDYQTLGDMQVPLRNVEGLWESVDTTNDSWGYAWYDQNWKTPKAILGRLIACVARGGTYMLNVGPSGDGSIPERAANSLRTSGEWIRRYPQVVYGTDASPWQHALPWGDVTVKDNTLFLSVMHWPESGFLYLPGLETEIVTAKLLSGDQAEEIQAERLGSWTRLSVPVAAPEELVSVIEIELAGSPKADATWGIDPQLSTEIEAEFATVVGAVQKEKRWMEKFGEWKHVVQVTDWASENSKATWEVDVIAPGDYLVELTYAGQDRLVWSVSIEDGQSIQNQQNASHNYQSFPIGWLRFPHAGRYRVSASCVEGNTRSASLKSIHFKPVSAAFD